MITKLDGLWLQCLWKINRWTGRRMSAAYARQRRRWLEYQLTHARN